LLIAMALLGFGRGGRGRTVTAEFTDVRGLVAGAQVRLAGVPVGSVTAIRLGPDDWPRVTLALDGGVALHADARAAVRLLSLSGEHNRYVSIEQGSGPALPARAVIPRAQTTSPVELDAALTTFDPPTRTAIARALTGMSSTLHGDGPAIAATLAAAARALQQVQGLAGDVGIDGAALQTLVAATDRLSTTLAGHSNTLAAAVGSSSRITHAVANRATALSAGIADLPAGLDTARTALVHVRALISPAALLLRTAGPALLELPATAARVDRATRVAPPALGQAERLALAAPSAARDFSPVLREAAPLLRLLIPILKRSTPMLDQLRVRLPDAFSFFANWADFTSNYDANGHAARAGIVLSPTPDKVLSPSSNAAGQLQPPYLRTPGALEGQPWSDYAKSFVTR
jgi:phospholipid/cholesterol/gamma-HCH transport system substrate-binding protein